MTGFSSCTAKGRSKKREVGGSGETIKANHTRIERITANYILDYDYMHLIYMNKIVMINIQFGYFQCLGLCFGGNP
jgi:hypothetical protein